MNLYFTLQQAAEQTGLSESTLRRAIKDGALNALKVKGLIRISERALLTWFEKEAEGRDDTESEGAVETEEGNL